MKTRLSRKSLVVLAVVTNAFVGILINIVSDDIKNILMQAGIDQYSRIQITVGLLVTSLLVTTVILYIAEKNKSKDEIPADILTKSEKDQREFSANLARRYEQRYAHKLDGRYEIPLLVSDEVEGTQSQLSDEDFDTDAHMSKAARYVIERFETRGRLLIVGSPGSGKTVLLLNLAKYLAEKVQKDANQPLPIIFNLASWSPDYASFNDWVTAMLTKGYGLSSNFAKHLQEEQLIVYLLDGLDELASNEEPLCAARVRAKCMASLYGLLHDGSMSAVICCRRDEFDEMIQTGTEPPVPVLTVHDLSPVRIDHALIRATHTKRDKFAAPHLQATLNHDSIYYQVLSTPFYFTTALQVFDSTGLPIIDALDRKTLESNLIEAFVEKKLRVTTNARRFPTARTLAWLTWLAVFLNNKEHVTFELSDLQPSTLKRRWRYRLLFSMTCGVFGGLLIGLVRWSAIFGVISGMLFGLIVVYLITEDFAQWTLKPLRRWFTWLIILLLGLAVCILSGCLLLIMRIDEYGVIDGLLMPDSAALAVVYLALIVGLMTVVFSVVIYTFVRGAVGILGGVPLGNIITEDFAQWTLGDLRRRHTWFDILRSSFRTAVTGFIIISAIFYGLSPIVAIQGVAKRGVSISVGEIMGIIILVVIFPIAFGLMCAPFGAFVGIVLGLFGACRKTARFANINSPYQRLRAGIFFNILQFVVIGAAFNYLIIVVNLLTGWSSSRGSNDSFFPEFFLVLIFGLIGLYKAALTKHSALRICLALEGSVPLRYANFLSYATELRILEKEGGQWRFRHQILQDYFARRAQNSGSGLAQT